MSANPLDREQRQFAAHVDPCKVASRPEGLPPYAPHGNSPRRFGERGAA